TNYGPANQTGITDNHIVQAGLLSGKGRLVVYQSHVFKDARTGSGGIPIDQSGYIITHEIAYDKGDKQWRQTVTKRGFAIAEGQFPTGPGVTLPGNRPITGTQRADGTPVE